MAENDGWHSVFIENHDNPRSFSRYVSDWDLDRDLGLKLLALMQMILSGTISIYQGEELGMRNVPACWDTNEYRDVESINFWKASIAFRGHNPDLVAKGKKVLVRKARDHSSTPMQWSDAPHSGFCAPNVQP